MLRGRLHGTSGGGGGGGAFEGIISRAGLHLRNQLGHIWKCRAITAFSGLHDWIERRTFKLETYAIFTKSLNCNTWRVFCVWNNLGLKPDNDRYYDELQAFLEWLKSHGLYCHLVLLCDQVGGSAVHMSRSQQLDHIAKCVVIARRVGNCLIEVFNEFEKNDGDGVCDDYVSSAFDGVASTRSWWGENQHYNHAGSLIDWTTGHTDRGQEWARQCIQSKNVQRDGYGLPDGSHVPATGLPHILGEPRRIAEGSTARQHADYVAGGLLFGAGSCLHGGFKTFDSRHESDLQFCIAPISSLAYDCCVAVGDVHAATLWPLNTPEGNYVRGGVDNWNNDNKPDCPIIHRDRYFGGPPEGQPGAPAGEYLDGSARDFFMEMGGLYYGLAVDPGPNWILQVRPGFVLVAQGGYQGNMLVLRRN